VSAATTRRPPTTRPSPASSTTPAPSRPTDENRRPITPRRQRRLPSHPELNYAPIRDDDLDVGRHSRRRGTAGATASQVRPASDAPGSPVLPPGSRHAARFGSAVPARGSAVPRGPARSRPLIEAPVPALAVLGAEQSPAFDRRIVG